MKPVGDKVFGDKIEGDVMWQWYLKVNNCKTMKRFEKLFKLWIMKFENYMKFYSQPELIFQNYPNLKIFILEILSKT